MSTEIEDIVVFTVPYLTPPSVNHVYKDTFYTGRDGYTHRGRKISPEAKAFKAAVAIFAQGRTVAPATDKERKKVRYRVDVEMALGPRKRLDGDNGLKVAIDALVYAGVIHADSNVISRAIPIKDQRDNPHTTYIVERLA